MGWRMNCDVVKQRKGWRMSCDVGKAELRVIVIAELILQPFRHFNYITVHSPTLSSLYLRHSSFSNPSVVHLRHSSFSNPSFACPTSQALHLIHLASSAHSPTFPLLHLRHNSFFNPSVALPTSQLILQPFFRFSYVTGSSLTSPGEPPMLTSNNNHNQ